MNRRSDPMRYVMEPTGDDLGLTEQAVADIRHWASVIAGVDLADKGQIDSARFKLYDRLALEMPPVIANLRAGLGPAGQLPWGEKGIGLQSRKQWCLELAACKAFGQSAAAVARLGGTIYEPHVDSKTGIFFLGSSTVEKLTGLDRKNVDGWRKQLAENGWLHNTGQRKGRAIIWELRLPDCQCGNHGRYIRRDHD